MTPDSGIQNSPQCQGTIWVCVHVGAGRGRRITHCPYVSPIAQNREFWASTKKIKKGSKPNVALHANINNGSHNLTYQNSRVGFKSHRLMAPRGQSCDYANSHQEEPLENSTHSATGLSCKSRSRPSPHPVLKEEQMAVRKRSSFSLLDPMPLSKSPEHEPITCGLIFFY